MARSNEVSFASNPACIRNEFNTSALDRRNPPASVRTSQLTRSPITFQDSNMKTSPKTDTTTVSPSQGNVWLSPLNTHNQAINFAKWKTTVFYRDIQQGVSPLMF